ncbi:MAG: acyltransferase [Acidimicrobiia bacterium]
MTQRIPAWKRLFRSASRHVSPLRRFSIWIHDVLGDGQLLMLTLVGYVPSHHVRNLCYRKAGIVIPSTSSLHWRARFFSPQGLSIGEYSSLGNDGFYDARSGITIGASVNIAGEVRIYTREHDVNSCSFAEIGGPVIIDDYVYIGTRVTVLPNIHIGEGAVVASGAVVTRDVDPYQIVAGVPARCVGERTRGLSYRLGYAKRFQ